MRRNNIKKSIWLALSVLMILATSTNALAITNDASSTLLVKDKTLAATCSNMNVEDETVQGGTFDPRLLREPLTVDEIKDLATINGVYVDETATGSRGDNPPTTNTVLPYTGSGSALTQSVYSNYKFLPNSNGTITMTFTGTVSSGTATITIYLYDATTGSSVKSWSLGTGSAWTNVSPSPNPFTGLSTSTYYYYRIVKTPTTNTLAYTLVCK